MALQSFQDPLPHVNGAGIHYTPRGEAVLPAVLHPADLQVTPEAPVFAPAH